MHIKYLINYVFLFVARCDSLVQTLNISVYDICPLYKKGPSLNVQDVVGSWMTVYTQPKAIDCFKFDIRATTELLKINQRNLTDCGSLMCWPLYLEKQGVTDTAYTTFITKEREQYVTKYGDFEGRVDWNSCLLQIETPLGKHFLQGNGTESGLMENIIMHEKNGEYTLQNQSADQWMVFGRRGSEVLMIRDCYGDTAAAFARAPYWPTAPELSAIFHRSGIAAQTHGRLLCEPQENPTRLHKFGDTYQHKRNY